MKAFLPLALLAAAAFSLLRRHGDDWEYEQDDPVTEEAPAVLQVTRRRPATRFAYVATFTLLFFAGASFTAGAGDRAVRLIDEDAAALAEFGETAAEQELAAAEAAAEVAPATEPVVDAEPAPEAAAPEAVSSEVLAAEIAAAAADAGFQQEAAPSAGSVSNLVAPTPAKLSSAAATSAQVAPAPAVKPAASRTSTKQWVVKRAGVTPAVEPEIEREQGEPTIWLNRALPDPTPASARLTRSFAKQLAAVSKRHGADWATVLGVLRAQGERGAVPATTADLDTLASRLAGEKAWRGALAMSGRITFADRAAALADLYRSVGIEALVTGLQVAKERLATRLLADDNVWIYGSGREDIAAGRIDVRVIVLLGYLAERHGSLTVSSLFSGHRKFARAGVVSAHTYGHAVDIAAVGEISIAGHQQPGGVTEAAVRSVLLLPAELQPQQVISLLGLGGASFPLRDHGDHIHVGF